MRGVDPADWKTAHEMNANLGNDCLPTDRWPFNPRHPLAWQPALKPCQQTPCQYVRVVGSLITDSGHVEEAIPPQLECRYFGVACDWDSDTRAKTALRIWGDADNRWVEMHPPDIIAVLKNGPGSPAETFRGVAAVSDNCLSAIGQHCASTSLDTDIAPPGPQPHGARIAFAESVGSETNADTIVEGQTQTDRVTVFADHVHVHVVVRGQTAWGAPGKFKALYRVWWRAPRTGGPN